MNPFRPNTSGEKFFRPPFRLQPIERLEQDRNIKKQRSADDLPQGETRAEAKRCNETLRGCREMKAELISPVKDRNRTRVWNSKISVFNEKSFCSLKSCPNHSRGFVEDLDDWFSVEEQNKPEVTTYRDPYQRKNLSDLSKNMKTVNRCMEMKYPESMGKISGPFSFYICSMWSHFWEFGLGLYCLFILLFYSI